MMADPVLAWREDHRGRADFCEMEGVVARAGDNVAALQAERRAEMAEMEEILAELKPLLAAETR